MRGLIAVVIAAVYAGVGCGAALDARWGFVLAWLLGGVVAAVLVADDGR